MAFYCNTVDADALCSYLFALLKKIHELVNALGKLYRVVKAGAQKSSVVDGLTSCNSSVNAYYRDEVAVVCEISVSLKCCDGAKGLIIVICKYAVDVIAVVGYSASTFV